MAGSSIGEIFKVTTWGESHGKALGAVIDGCPSNIEITEEYIQTFLDRRRPGQSQFTTSRNETDVVQILSGVFEGKTTGTPISLIVFNEDQHSADYSSIKDVYRPGHADYTFFQKYGIRDYRGGGRSSGRETIGRVAGGAIAVKILKELGISIQTYTKSIGSIKIDYSKFDYSLSNTLNMPDSDAFEKASAYLRELIKEGNSSGGTIECVVKGVPVGLGEPTFEKLDANLAKAVMSIGAVKAVEIGTGARVSEATGLDNNDSFTVVDGKAVKCTNNAGGILGGISDGSDIVINASVKPTPSIATSQNTLDINNNPIAINIKGRHDPVIVPRAVVVVEAMVAITIVDALFKNMSSNIDAVKRMYIM